MHECHGGDNQKFYWQANYFKQDMHVATKLCGLASNEEPDPPMCDIIQVSMARRPSTGSLVSARASNLLVARSCEFLLRRREARAPMRSTKP